MTKQAKKFRTRNPGGTWRCEPKGFSYTLINAKVRKRERKNVAARDETR